jgi:hypothetical protein
LGIRDHRTLPAARPENASRLRAVASELNIVAALTKRQIWKKEGKEMTDLVVREDFVRNLFDFRHDFDEIFNWMLTAKP